jgi:peptide/nickel transport system substrate-binding protein
MKKIVRFKSLFLCVVLVLFVFSACTKNSTKSEGKVVVTIGSNAEVLTSFDRMVSLGYGGDDNGYLWGDYLVWTDHIGNYTPALALEWSVSEDYLSYTFKLRQGVKFHDGTDCSAKDVKKTYERLIEDATLTDAPIWVAGLDHVEVADDHTIIIRLKSVMPTFFDEVARIPIISEAAFTKNPATYFHLPTGTGAYKITSFDRTTGEAHYARNDDWWGWTSQNKSNVDELIYKNILEDTTRVSALQAGDIDIAVQLTVGYQKTLEGSYNIIQRSMDSHMHIGFQCEDGALFSDKNLREAFSLAIDRQLIVDSVLEGGGVVATWPAPEGNRGYVAGHKFDYNPERAKALIAASNYKGEPIPMMMTNASFARAAEVAQAIQSMVAEVGFNITLEPLEKATFNVRRVAGDYPIMLYRFTTTCGDPQKEATAIISLDEFGTHYANDDIRTPGGKMKALGLSLLSMGDLKERTAALERFFAMEMEDFAPFAYLYSPVLLYCTNKSINNLTVFADGSADYRFLQKR